jgi:hypothetical protein
VNPRAGLDRCAKSRPPLGFEPRTVQSYLVAIPTEQSRPTELNAMNLNSRRVSIFRLELLKIRSEAARYQTVATMESAGESIY